MKIAYIIGGAVFALLGFVGILLPIIPQIPFILFSMYCFKKSGILPEKPQ